MGDKLKQMTLFYCFQLCSIKCSNHYWLHMISRDKSNFVQVMKNKLTCAIQYEAYVNVIAFHTLIN